ncbi:MAG: hypothetical protein R6V72_15290 [Cyclobacterium sp.]|uniref:hypothetical protein n=1 Tax=Cyclobacterium sp. TaxID=1966343 RepID=UPI003970E6BA
MNKEKIIKLSLKVVVVVVLVYGADSLYTNYYNSLTKAYTIGTLGSTYKPYGQGSKIRFTFEFYGKKFKSDNPKGYNEAKSKTYLIEVPVKDIDKSRILWDYPVPDTLKAPYEGWKEIPAFLSNKEEGD